MRVIVDKDALEEAISRILSEDRSPRSADISSIPAKEDDEPIDPTPQMAMQLSSDMPPVDDPEYIPSNTTELSRAASVISNEVPSDQVEFFYRRLHRLLDLSIDKHDEKTYGKNDDDQKTIHEQKFRQAVEKLLENLEDDDGLDRPLSIEDDVQVATDNIVDYFMKNPALFADVDVNDETGEMTPRGTESRLIHLRAMGEIRSNRRIQKMMNSLSDDEKRTVRSNVVTYLSQVLGSRDVTPEEVAGYVAAGKKEAESRSTTKELAKIRKETGLTGVDLANAIRERADEIEATGDTHSAKRLRNLADETEQEELEPENTVDIAASRENINPDEAAKIRRQLRDEALDEEGISLQMSNKALQSLKDKISDETGLKVNNIQNILYDDLKVFGFSPEDAATLGFPTDRKIPSTYDPLKLKAQDDIVGSVYDLFRSVLRDYVESVGYDDDDEMRVLGDLLDNDSPVFPGDSLEGYLVVQNTAVDPKNIDTESQSYIDQRNAFEAVVGFIQQVAKDVLDSDKTKGAKEGGIRAFIQQLDADGVFRRSSSDEIYTSEKYDDYMLGVINDIDNIILDEEAAYKMLEAALKSAPKRVSKFRR
ncbi:hypothetical protein CMI47_18905 [Candidatus Pacearchaeota archaeon]|nr:hypothetical protein [Candidatus Pacearchaeota archaeon]|tara:strand:+ start:19395 stop:21173 length:1779 start_codon:yes stop_codon:yes gene_type:complete